MGRPPVIVACVLFIPTSRLCTCDALTRVPPAHPAHDARPQLAVFTSDILGAGTTAHILVELRGARGASGPLELRRAQGAFTRGGSDVFDARVAPDPGDLQLLEVWHDGAGAGPGWHLDRVEVTHRRSGKVSTGLLD